METRYAVAYINDGDKQTNCICLFGQTKFEVNLLKQYLISYIAEKETAEDTYNALANNIGHKIGKDVELVFNNGEPTIWRVVESK
jgi:hypothetical protein